MCKLKMCKLLVPLLFVLMIIGCDPLYHVNYVVRNQSSQTIYVINHNGRSEGFEIVNLTPGSIDTVYKESGVGYPKPFYEEQKKDIFKAMNFFADSTFADSSIFIPASEWNYTEAARFEGTAVLTINPSDIKK